ncbi:hypothetical protein NKH55_01370 [Mesorhizobium opportunistum]|uniref:hypothetical protein n=1 Tax=Mesorhizobium opportunistum TaxID=593909 RepID=UPI00333E0E7B
MSAFAVFRVLEVVHAEILSNDGPIACKIDRHAWTQFLNQLFCLRGKRPRRPLARRVTVGGKVETNAIGAHIPVNRQPTRAAGRPEFENDMAAKRRCRAHLIGVVEM